MDELLTITEASKKLKIGRSKLYNLINSRKLIAKKNGYKTVVLLSSLNEYINSLPDYKPI